MCICAVGFFDFLSGIPFLSPCYPCCLPLRLVLFSHTFRSQSTTSCVPPSSTHSDPMTSTRSDTSTSWYTASVYRRRRLYGSINNILHPSCRQRNSTRSHAVVLLNANTVERTEFGCGGGGQRGDDVRGHELIVLITRTSRMVTLEIARGKAGEGRGGHHMVRKIRPRSESQKSYSCV